MLPVILTAVLAALIFLYAGWAVYKLIKRTKEGKSCCGSCSNCDCDKSKTKN